MLDLTLVSLGYVGNMQKTAVKPKSKPIGAGNRLHAVLDRQAQILAAGGYAPPKLRIVPTR